MIAASVDDHVRMHVAGDRPNDPDAVSGVLENAGLLDVHLDPADEVVEDVRRLAPAPGLVAGFLRVLPERPSVVDGPKVSRNSTSVTRPAMMRLPSSIWPKPDPSSSRKEITWSGSPRRSSWFSRQTSSAQTTPIVPSYLPPLRFESQWDPMPNTALAVRPVSRNHRTDGIVLTREPELLERPGHVFEGVPVDARVGISAGSRRSRA